jgi:hypothetical protein
MSLVGAPIAERRRWVAEVAPKLYNLQKARFQYISQGQARERKLAWKLVKLQRGPVYLRAIAQTISHFDLNDIATLSHYWKILQNAEEDQDFARILTFNSVHPDARTPSTITLNNDYIEGSAENVDLNKVQQVTTRYRIAVQEGKVLSPIQTIRELSRYGSGFGAFMSINSFREVGVQTLDNRMINSQTVPCVLGGLPLRHIQEIEIARSGKILKFRATGSVFLASQEGGEDAIRVEGILVRSEVIYILAMFALFYYGQGKVKEIDNLVELFGNPGLMAFRAKNMDITTYNKTIQKPAYTYHRTLPFVTRHVIIPNVYIETLSFEERLDLGKDVIGYSILLRTYRKPEGFEVYSEGPTLSYLSAKGNQSLNMFKMIEFFANMAWRFINSQGIFIKEMEWKIGNDTAESDDVYYNIDASSIASTVALGMVGLM